MSYHSYANNVLSYDMNRPAGTAYYHKPRGSWRIKELYAITLNGEVRAPTNLDSDVSVNFQVTEPLLSSPFIRFRLRQTRLLWYPKHEISMVMNGGSAKR
ncbi:MAG: hypothetical protein ACKPKO_26865, partial [Candidatus Fonsibacter sp.]